MKNAGKVYLILFSFAWYGSQATLPRLWFGGTAGAPTDCQELVEQAPQSATRPFPYCAETPAGFRGSIGLPIRIQVAAAGEGTLNIQLLLVEPDGTTTQVAEGSTEVRLRQKPTPHVLTLEPNQARLLEDGTRLRILVDGKGAIQLGKQSYVVIAGTGDEGRE